MPKDAKEKYFALAREVDAEHKRKYPGTFYTGIFLRPRFRVLGSDAKFSKFLNAKRDMLRTEWLILARPDRTREG